MDEGDMNALDSNCAIKKDEIWSSHTTQLNTVPSETSLRLTNTGSFLQTESTKAVLHETEGGTKFPWPGEERRL